MDVSPSPPVQDAAAGSRAPASEGPAPRPCTRHPDRETFIACGRCERPFCPDCLIYTPAGQRCYECAGIRRDAAQRAAAASWIKAAAAVLIGAAIASFAGFFGLLVAGVTGSVAGQALSPVVNRRTRKLVYSLGSMALVACALLGWTLATMVQLMALSAARAPGFALLYWSVPLALLQNWVFWVFVGIAAVVAYQRLR